MRIGSLTGTRHSLILLFQRDPLTEWGAERCKGWAKCHVSCGHFTAPASPNCCNVTEIGTGL